MLFDDDSIRVLVLVLLVLLLPKIIKFVECFTYETDPILDDIKVKISPLFNKSIKYDGVLSPLNTRDILSEISMYKGDKSYTINKENVFICLKDKEDNYYNMNMLVYVTLHEISHVINPTIGHDDGFNKVFNALLDKATQMGIYDPNQKIDFNYCK